MPKNLLQDIKPMSKRSSATTRKTRVKEKEPEVLHTEDSMQYSQPSTQNTINIERESSPVEKNEVMDIRNDRNTSGSFADEISTARTSRKGIWVIAIVAIVALFFAISFLFSGASIVLSATTKDVSLDNTTVTSSKDAGDGALSFDIMSISDTASTTVPASGSTTSGTVATGRVILYNAFSKDARTLIINTRLEANNGKIYKTDAQVVIPGMKGTTPGSVEVGVHASAQGEEYNSPLTDFKIVAFKGTTKESKVYARSKTEITGGASGNVHTITADEASKAQEALLGTLKDKLTKEAAVQIPKGFISYPDAVFIATENTTPNLSSTDVSVPVTIKATLTALMWNKDALSKKIAQDNLSDYNGAPVTIPNLDTLTLALKDKANIKPADAKDISFTLSGKAHIVWTIDTDKLLGDLVGKNKSVFKTVLASYPAVSEGEVFIKPFWKSSFPSDKTKIKIEIKTPDTK